MSTDYKRIVRSVNDAFSRNDLDAFFRLCTEDVTWTLIGKPPMRGKGAITDFFNQMGPDTPPPFLELEELIAEGDRVACTGTMEMPDSKGGTYRGAFCDIYYFRDGLVSDMRSYIVDLKEEEH